MWCVMWAPPHFLLLFVYNSFTSAMVSVSAGRPIWDNFATLEASVCTEKNILDLMRWVGDGIVADTAHTMEWGGSIFFLETVKAEEDGAVSVSTIPVSLATSVGPTSFVAWS